MSRVLYFAYGSNMDSSTLRGRRGIEWMSAVPALARGWRLAIDKPSMLGTGEGMATLVCDDKAETWGVVFEISTEDFEHLALTEGVLIGHYERREIPVTIAVSDETAAAALARGEAAPTRDAAAIVALTFTSDERDPSSKPSTRYMRLLLAGAAEHGLPDTWIEKLRAVDAVEESAAAASLAAARDAAMRKQRG